MQSRLPLWLSIVGVVPALVLGCLAAETAPSHPAGWLLLALSVAYVVVLALSRSVTDGCRVLVNGGVAGWLVLSGSLGVLIAAPAEHLALSEFVAAGDLLDVAGAAFAALGAALGAWAQAVRRTLRQGQAHAAVLVGLLRRGPYRAVRHPGYLAVLLVTLGVALGYGSAAARGIIAILLLPGLVVRIRREDQKMFEVLGAAYEGYASRTRRLVPGLW